MRTTRPPLPGWLETLRQRLFATPVDIVVSFLCLYVVWRISLPLVDWLLVEANWRGTSREDCTSAGACWVFIRARFAQFMYGQYPVSERWRVDLLGVLAVCVAVALSWRGLPRNEEAAPLFRSSLRPVTDPNEKGVLRGGLTNSLKADLEDAVLFYKGNWYKLGKLPAGAETDLTPRLREAGNGKPKNDWFNDSDSSWYRWDLRNARERRGQHNQSQSSLLMKNILFHKADTSGSGGQNLRTSTLRHLDQSWRLSDKHADEVILVGRLAPAEAAADKLDGSGVAPTRLWEGQLPEAGKRWTYPPGKINQETYVRVYIPLVRSP